MDHPLFELQLKLEREMIDTGVEAYRRALERAQQDERVSETAHGARLVRVGVESLIKAIEEWLVEASAVKRGRRFRALPYIKAIGAERCAFITVRALVDRIMSSDEPMLLHVAERIGRLVNDEARFEAFEKADAKAFSGAVKSAKRGTNDRERRATILTLGGNRAGVDMDLWPADDRLQIGIRLIELAAASTGFVKLVRVYEAKKDTPYIVSPTQEVLDFMRELASKYELLHPAYFPTVVPPKPWTGAFSGGYWSDFAAKPALVRKAKRSQLNELDRREIGSVLSAINAVQGTGYRINRGVLEVAEECYRLGISVGKLPTTQPETKTPRPSALVAGAPLLEQWKAEGNKAAIDAWREENKDTLLAYRSTEKRRYEREAKRISRALQASQMISTAKRFATYDAIYFPHNFDFRGRMYAIPTGLNPQGSDIAKALLLFATGKALSAEGNGMFWLRVHAANTWGYDKVSFEDREAWTIERMADIRAAAADPLAHLDWWQQADKPWQFLAACFELAAAEAHGPGFVSSLPVGMDGSCNGLQHYSAMLRDSEGGALVNLTPSALPSDIYAKVADAVRRKLTAVIAGTDVMPLPEKAAEAKPAQEWARLWLEFGVDRKITKRSVMTLPYSATMRSCRDFVQEAASEKVRASGKNPFASTRPDGTVDDGLFMASLAVYQTVWAAIGEVVRGAKDAMAFLTGCARAATSALATLGLGVNWVCPDGFYVDQTYHNLEKKLIKTAVDGKMVRFVRYDEVLEINKREMQNAIAPNFVHSMDGTALRMFVNYAEASGIASFSLVHDSYATVAEDVDLMQACIREAFVDLYEQNDVLAQFRESICEMLEEEDAAALPEVPQRGDLELALVRESDFFFS